MKNAPHSSIVICVYQALPRTLDIEIAYTDPFESRITWSRCRDLTQLPPIKRLFSLYGAEFKYHIIELEKFRASNIAVFSGSSQVVSSSKHPPPDKRSVHSPTDVEGGFRLWLCIPHDLGRRSRCEQWPDHPSDIEDATIPFVPTHVRACMQSTGRLTSFISYSEAWLELQLPSQCLKEALE